MSDRPWNDQETELLKTLVETTDLTFEQIGKRLGRTKNQCIGKARRMFLVRKTEHVSRAPRKEAKKKPVRHEAPPPILVSKEGCRWIEGHPERGKPVEFCCEPIERGSYCAEHAARCYLSDVRSSANREALKRSGIGRSTA